MIAGMYRKSGWEVRLPIEPGGCIHSDLFSDILLEQFQSEPPLSDIVPDRLRLHRNPDHRAGAVGLWQHQRLVGQAEAVGHGDLVLWHAPGPCPNGNSFRRLGFFRGPCLGWAAKGIIDASENSVGMQPDVGVTRDLHGGAADHRESYIPVQPHVIRIHYKDGAVDAV